MSEFSSINLVLGIVGTVTGIIALFIHFWRLRRESPRLETKVLKCEHDFTVSISQIKTISFWIEVQIRNLGDRGTSINDMDVTFEDDGKTHRLKKRHFRGPRGQSKRRWINAHDIIDVGADFYETFQGNDREQIDCTLIIYHTHGSKEVKTISQRRSH